MIRRGILLTLIAILGAFAAAPVLANTCATPGRNGAGVALSGVVNTYFAVTANAAAGATNLTLSAGTGAASDVAVGDLLLVIQIQDATLNVTDTSSYGDGTAGGGGGVTGLVGTGVYEFVRATSVKTYLGAGVMTIAGGSGGGLINAYTNAAATGTRGARRYQIIKVPQYASASLGSALSARAWDGTTGGVLVLDVAADLNLNGGMATVSGLGFRGGGGRTLSGAAGGSNAAYRSLSTAAYHAAKGEGVAGTPTYVNNAGSLANTGGEGYPNGSNGRGAPGNAGGGGNDGNPNANDQNTGGGGGAGLGGGGQGGNAWSSNAAVGGVGGVGVTQTTTRLAVGGGGGAGSTNNGTGSLGSGLASSGAAGGGIVIIRAGTISGTGAVTANGAAANMSVTNDGSGGGGGGGSILIAARNLAGGASLAIEARGGSGGTNTGGGAAHGPGGGGGGGYVATTITASANVSGGAAGTTAGGIVFGAVAGSSGGSELVGASSIPGVSSGVECTPTVTKSFSPSQIIANQISRLTLTVSNPNPTLAMTGTSVLDAYPSGLMNAAAPNASTTCSGATVTAAGLAASLGLSGGSVPAQGTCTVSVNVTSNAPGDRVNVISAGDLDGTMGSVPVTSLTAVQATMTVVLLPPLTASKSAVTVSDPINNTINPKAIPGSFVDFTIEVANPSNQATDLNSVFVSDVIPAGTLLWVGDIATAGGGPLAFLDGSPPSNLTYGFVSLSSPTDNLDFSQDGGLTWLYTPTPNAQGLEPNVTHIRVRPSGTQAAGSRFTVRFRVRVP